ncbi:hypothetical protein K438DRAFT_1749361 [Mycena galopus ATCC 62051]|nr:hypothetical protein K438DRAFT_1749361 [Mycena galopus ATCC 62051]
MVCVSACIRERWDQEKTKIEMDDQLAPVFAFGSEAPSSSQRDPSRLANFTSVAAGRTVAEKWLNADECVYSSVIKSGEGGGTPLQIRNNTAFSLNYNKYVPANLQWRRKVLQATVLGRDGIKRPEIEYYHEI